MTRFCDVTTTCADSGHRCQHYSIPTYLPPDIGSGGRTRTVAVLPQFATAPRRLLTGALRRIRPSTPSLPQLCCHCFRSAGSPIHQVRLVNVPRYPTGFLTFGEPHSPTPNIVACEHTTDVQHAYTLLCQPDVPLPATGQLRPTLTARPRFNAWRLPYCCCVDDAAAFGANATTLQALRTTPPSRLPADYPLVVLWFSPARYC